MALTYIFFFSCFCEQRKIEFRFLKKNLRFVALLADKDKENIKAGNIKKIRGSFGQFENKNKNVNNNKQKSNK